MYITRILSCMGRCIIVYVYASSIHEILFFYLLLYTYIALGVVSNFCFDSDIYRCNFGVNFPVFFVHELFFKTGFGFLSAARFWCTLFHVPINYKKWRRKKQKKKTVPPVGKIVPPVGHTTRRLVKKTATFRSTVVGKNEQTAHEKKAEEHKYI